MNSTLKKLMFKGQNPVLILNMPEEYAGVAKDMRVEIHDQPNRVYAFVQIFALTVASARELVKKAMKAVDEDTYLWFCYPKGTSRNYRSDLDRDSCCRLFSAAEYEPVSQVAINDDWTAMRFRHVDRINTLRRKVAMTRKGQERLNAGS